MPNWVMNTVFIEGSKEQLEKVVAKLSAKDSVYTQQYEGEVVFSFHNIVSPPEDKFEEYNTTAGFANGERLGNTAYNWYNWNLAYWDTKWDARDVSIVHHSDTQIIYQFDTAWSPVEGLMLLLSRMFPEVSIEYEYEEEQGWGGDSRYFGGYQIHSTSYDAPLSHADYEALGRDCDACYTDSPYYDCPTDEVAFVMREILGNLSKMENEND